ncbi:hypothetical protein UT300005_30900 [Clostridium sp. CTA-5]
MASISSTDINNILGKTDASSAVNKKSGTTGKLTTDKGTKIVKSGGEFDKNSFLKILSAQLSNLDPTANQDSTAYVTQMAQFAAMEQMYNLNDTMSTSSYQQLVGKGVTMNLTNDEGQYYTGIIRGISKDQYGTYASVEINQNGKNIYKVFDVKNIDTILEVPNYSSEMLSNSDFSVALSLKDQKAVISTYDEKGKNIIVKGTVKSAFIDKGVVKVRVETGEKDEDGNPIIEEYPYASIIKAGDLTEKDMDVKPEEPPAETGTVEKSGTSQETTSSTNENKTSNVLSMVENTTKDGYKADYDSQLQKLYEILGK